MLEAAEAYAVRERILPMLDALVRKSMVKVERSGEVDRYGMVETIRQ